MDLPQSADETSSLIQRTPEGKLVLTEQAKKDALACFDRFSTEKPTVEQKENYLSLILDITGSIAHPVYEGADTLFTFAYFLSNVLNWSTISSYITGGSAALAVFYKEAAFITARELQRKTGKKDAGKHLFCLFEIPGFQQALPLPLWIGCLAGGLKFAMGMDVALTVEGESLSLWQKIMVASVGIFRFSKERMVSYEVALRTLKELGFHFKTVEAILHTIPFVNGEIPLVDLQKIVAKAQPPVEGCLHAVAVWQSMKILYGEENPLQDAINGTWMDKLRVGFMLWLATVAASGEKMAQTYDQEEIVIQMLRPNMQAAVRELALREGVAAIDPSSQKIATEEESEEESSPGWFSRFCSRSKQAVSTGYRFVERNLTRGLSFAFGSAPSKVVDVANIANPFMYAAPRGTLKLIKAIGQSCYGFIAAKKIGEDGMPGTGRFFQNHNSWLYGTFVPLTFLAGLAQWNAREIRAKHGIQRTITGPQSGDNAPQGKCATFKHNMTHYIKHVLTTQCAEGEESEGKKWFKRQLDKLDFTDDSIVTASPQQAADMLDEDITKLAEFVARNMNHRTKTKSDLEQPLSEPNLAELTSGLRLALLDACVQDVDLAATIHLMMKLDYESMPDEAQKIFADAQFQVNQVEVSTATTNSLHGAGV